MTDLADSLARIFCWKLNDFISECDAPNALEADSLALFTQASATMPNAKRC